MNKINKFNGLQQPTTMNNNGNSCVSNTGSNGLNVSDKPNNDVNYIYNMMQKYGTDNNGRNINLTPTASSQALLPYNVNGSYSNGNNGNNGNGIYPSASLTSIQIPANCQSYPTMSLNKGVGDMMSQLPNTQYSQSVPNLNIPANNMVGMYNDHAACSYDRARLLNICKNNSKNQIDRKNGLDSITTIATIPQQQALQQQQQQQQQPMLDKNNNERNEWLKQGTQNNWPMNYPINYPVNNQVQSIQYNPQLQYQYYPQTIGDSVYNNYQYPLTLNPSAMNPNSYQYNSNGMIQNVAGYGMMPTEATNGYNKINGIGNTQQQQPQPQQQQQQQKSLNVVGMNNAGIQNGMYETTGNYNYPQYDPYGMIGGNGAGMVGMYPSYGGINQAGAYGNYGYGGSNYNVGVGGMTGYQNNNCTMMRPNNGLSSGMYGMGGNGVGVTNNMSGINCHTMNDGGLGVLYSNGIPNVPFVPQVVGKKNCRCNNFDLPKKNKKKANV